MNNESIESVTTTAGLAGFIVLFSLAIGCWFLFRGMNKRLRNIRLREEREAEERSSAAEERTPEQDESAAEDTQDDDTTTPPSESDGSDGAPHRS